MGPVNGPVMVTLLLGLLQALAANVDASADKYEPMVAFKCNQPSMHRVVNGWEYDPTTHCLDRKPAILKYCKQLYPDHHITNIVEASYEVSIPDWPSYSGEKHTHRVRPYRCIVGAFQSDALLVPQHCVFDHHHDTTICQEFDEWNKTAIRMCTDRNMTIQSFAMLIDCDLDKFHGVEFVCCPKGNKAGKTVKLQPGSSKPGRNDRKGKHRGHYKTHAANKPDLNGNVYQLYLKNQRLRDQYKNEHQLFEAARQYMRKEQRGKIAKLMKEWQAAREHVSELKKTKQFKSADKLGKEITERFQRLYEAFEQEDAAEKTQIMAVHQQHIQSDLNQHKRNAMEKYMKALQRRDSHKILKYLRAYIKAEEKDRMHTVNHFDHVKYTNRKEAAAIQPHVIEHLKLIDQRMNQSLQMLSRTPELKKKILPVIEKFLERYKAVDASIMHIFHEPVKSAVHIHKDSKKKVNHEENKSSSQKSESVENYDSETSEDEHAYENDDHFVAHQLDHSQDVEQGVNQVAVHSVSNQVGSTFGIAIGSVAVFVIIVVAIVMLRRRSHRQPVTHGYVEVDPAASPEERHVANMQMNGYENPTYKYFESAPTQ